MIDSKTGEVIPFKTMYGTGFSKTSLDYSRKLEKRYKEVPPYAVDLEGNIINKKSVPVLVEDEPLMLMNISNHLKMNVIFIQF